MTEEIKKDRHRPGYWKERWQKQKKREIARRQSDSLVMEGRFDEVDSLRKKYDITSGEY